MLRCIQRTETDPYFNLAAEEFLLQHAACDTFMLWRNDRSVILGKHQNYAREVNHQVIEAEAIPVIRRITGGGTVFHDLGNINYSFIRLNRKDNSGDFRFFTRPVLTFLHDMGLCARFEEKSNLTVFGRKISGNSAHVYRGRVLHHGTLLFSTDLEMLERIIATGQESYNDKAVRSVTREVTNIRSNINASMGPEDFMEAFFSFIINRYPDAVMDHLKEEEKQAIQELAEKKYRDPVWNIGYSPDYQYSRNWSTPEGDFKLHLSTREAVIDRISLTGPDQYTGILESVAKSLSGALHEKNTIDSILMDLRFTGENKMQILGQIREHLF